jgi:Fuc2NAc and GlcNAc transferase
MENNSSGINRSSQSTRRLTLFSIFLFQLSASPISAFVLSSYFIFLILGAIGAYGISRYADKVGLLDKPNERSSHAKVTPKGGGLGLLFVLVGLGIFCGLPVWFWIPAAVVSIMSLFGDRINLPQKTRLVVQLSCAGATLLGYFFSTFHLSHPVPPWVCIVLGVGLAIYIAGTANFYNFMDGINGISGLTGIIAFGGLAFYAHVVQGKPDHFLVQTSLAIVCACIGFLPFNFPKARVFMGDVGSILLGFLFAVSVVILSDSWLDFICLNSFLFTFYADELTTMVVRIRARANLLQAHRRHIYQILVNQKKTPHWKITILYAVIQLLVGAISVCIRQFGIGMLTVWLLTAFACFGLWGYYVRRWEYPLEGRDARAAASEAGRDGALRRPSPRKSP